ncbi:hypothetical protein OBBRIDRAFT_791606 [Obba rivulosa]|uniref:Mixed lineage kinase domain-containing protein n=1 Tax=Obba rivulosa TaxID=1052685 RepID=A0A8E2B1S2_9APHY|nr:hypothetical protein OBBRIDRAFT_791606 [Obba rivulosa]
MPLVTGTDALAHTLFALQVASNISSAITVPFLSTILGSLTSLVETVEKVKGNKERCARLTQRVNDLAELIAKTVSGDPASVDDQLKDNLLQLHSTLLNIRQDVSSFARQSLLKRTFRHASIAEALDDHIDTLDASIRSFLITSSIVIRQKLEQQAPRDASGYRLFRIDDLGRLRARHSNLPVSGQLPGEMEGMWQGRAVVVKFLSAKSEEPKVDPKALVSRYPKILHPSVAPILGYSHSSLSQQFYVLDLGDSDAVPLLHFMSATPGTALLQHYLQMLVDYEDTFSYINTLWAYDERTADIPRRCNLHWHMGNCLPSAVLSHDGRIVIAIEDFLMATPTCLQRQLENLSRGPGRREFSGDRANEPAPLASAARALVPLFSGRGGTVSAHVIAEQLSRLTLWHCPLQRGVTDEHAVYDTIGSYGIMNHDDNFVRWGSAMDLFGKEENTDAWEGVMTREFKVYDGEEDTPLEFDVHSTEVRRHVVRLDTPRGRRMLSAIEEVTDDGLRTFFRDYAPDVRTAAIKRGLQIDALTMVCRRWQTADISWDLTEREANANADEYRQPESIGDEPEEFPYSDPITLVSAETTPAEIYFYQLPLMKNGRVPTPWGYWSLDPDPTPGPWPLFAVPGVYGFSVEACVGYAHQSVIEAKLLSFLRQHCDLLPVQQRKERFTEV